MRPSPYIHNYTPVPLEPYVDNFYCTPCSKLLLFIDLPIRIYTTGIPFLHHGCYRVQYVHHSTCIFHNLLNFNCHHRLLDYIQDMETVRSLLSLHDPLHHPRPHNTLLHLRRTHIPLGSLLRMLRTVSLHLLTVHRSTVILYLDQS